MKPSHPFHSLPQDILDIVIIGAGPAGLSAGLHVSGEKKKRSVLLVDVATPWKEPIQCAEAVGRLGFREAVTVRDSWIRQVINKASFHAPDGTVITYTDKNGGYIIDRALMQRDIASELSEQGVRVVLDKRVCDISIPDRVAGIRRPRTVTFADGSFVRAAVVIDASGPVGGFCKEDKITRKPADLEPSCFIVASTPELADDTVHIYADSKIAPGGYAWVFPRGRGGANIGIVIGAEWKGMVNIRKLLDIFLARHFPRVTVIKRFAGAIPCATGRRSPTTAWGLIKTGDAASTVNPISRAGIAEALLSGGLAGDHALLMLEARTETEMKRIGKSYETAWNKKRGSRHVKLSRVKNSLAQVPDQDYNTAAKTLVAIPQTDLTMAKIFRASLYRFPRLVWALRHLM